MPICVQEFGQGDFAPMRPARRFDTGEVPAVERGTLAGRYCFGSFLHALEQYRT